MKTFYTEVTYFHENGETVYRGSNFKFNEYDYVDAKKGIDRNVDCISKGTLERITLETDTGFVFFSLDVLKNCVIQLVVQDDSLDDYVD